MHILPLSQLSEEHLAVIGTKAYSLARLNKAHLAVPQAYVVSSEAFFAFLSANQLVSAIEGELDQVNIQEMHSVDYASRVIHDLILAAPWPEDLLTEILQQFVHLNAPRVSVRSSVFCERGYTTAWTGELLTSLNVSESVLPDQIKECWASLYNSRSLYHLYQQQIPVTDVHLAVIVQEMVQARVSGLAYTVHPVHRDRKQMVIEAGLGLGEAIVNGKIIPDTYVVRKDPFAILDKTVVAQAIAIAAAAQEGTATREVDELGREAKLQPAEIEMIAKACLRAEAAFGHAQTLEWALADELFFLQARDMDV